MSKMHTMARSLIANLLARPRPMPRAPPVIATILKMHSLCRFTNEKVIVLATINDDLISSNECVHASISLTLK